MKKEKFYTELRKQLEEIFCSADCGAFWIEDGNKLCKGICIDPNKPPFYSWLPFVGKNYLVIIYYEGKYRLEVRDEIGNCSHATYILLNKKWCDSVKLLEDIYFLIICQNGRYGVIDIKGNIAVPFEYDAIHPIKENYLFEVQEGNMIKIYDASTKLEYPSKVIYNMIGFLQDPRAQNECNLKAVEKFVKYELDDTKVFKNKYELTKWLSREHDISRIAKIDKFFRRVLQKQQYGVNNSYTYEEKMLEFIRSVEGCRTSSKYFEKVFKDCGKSVQFESRTQIVNFVKDEANMSFFVKNYKKICQAFKLKE